MFFRHCNNVSSRQDNSKIKLICLQDVLCWLGGKQNIKIIDQFSYFRLMVKYLKDLFLTKSLSITPLINSSLKTSLFQPGDYCINQLFSIIYEIFTSFDNGLEVRSVFLVTSKAFDKVWHDRLIFKLKQNGICGELLHILADFLSYRKQKVVLNG